MLPTFARQRQKRTVINRLSGIASICSATIICTRLAYFGILPLEWVAFIMLAVVVMAAIGNVATQLGICAIAIFLFAKYVSNGNDSQFKEVSGAILALIIAFIGLYIMIRGLFRRV